MTAAEAYCFPGWSSS